MQHLQSSKLYISLGTATSAEQSGKKVILFLGTTVPEEETFVHYARFVMRYYGESYAYYYKGHPGTPTGMFEQKQQQLALLNVIDVDSSIAAELILFFYPSISLSGYSSSTYSSVPLGMGKALFRMTKATGITNADYRNMDCWITVLVNVGDYNGVTVDPAHENYLVEFSDTITSSAGYSIAIWDATAEEITYYI